MPSQEPTTTTKKGAQDTSDTSQAQVSFYLFLFIYFILFSTLLTIFSTLPSPTDSAWIQAECWESGWI